MTIPFGPNDKPPGGEYDHVCDSADIYKSVSEQLPDPLKFKTMTAFELDDAYHFVLGQLGRKGVFTIEQRDFLLHYAWVLEDYMMDNGNW